MAEPSIVDLNTSQDKPADQAIKNHWNNTHILECQIHIYIYYDFYYKGLYKE